MSNSPVCDVNAIHLPSGDQSGSVGFGAPVVRITWTSPPPAGTLASTPARIDFRRETNPFAVRRPARRRILARRSSGVSNSSRRRCRHRRSACRPCSKSSPPSSRPARPPALKFKPRIFRDDPALAGGKVVIKNVRVAELVGSVVQRQPARHPRRARPQSHCRVVDGLRVVAVEIGNVNFAGAVGPLRLERDLGQADAFFAGDGKNDVVGKGVRLPPRRRAGVGARKKAPSSPACRSRCR